MDEYYKSPKLDNDEKTKQIIETAAKLIKNDIRALNPCNEYPTADDLTTENSMAFLPDSLVQFLQIIVASKNSQKIQASLGNAIVQVVRPRMNIVPLQWGLATQMHHHFGSRFLIDSLHQHGFCSSYQEVQMFEQNAAVAQPNTVLASEDQFVQYVVDNIDHNI